MKDVNVGGRSEWVEQWDMLKRIRVFEKSKALTQLTEVYKCWMAYADVWHGGNKTDFL